MVDASSLSNSCIKMSVSVIMITYNHEAYIAEAIEGVLMQEVDFPVELIIADDCSPDDTATIVQEFINNHPKGSWIKYTRHSQNKGMMPNFIWALEQAKGNYIALCEGDDFWTDTLKLHRQIAELEKDLSLSLCIHRVRVQNESRSIAQTYLPNTHRDSNYYTFERIVENWDVQTASFVFRNSPDLQRDLSYLMEGLPFGDLPLVYYMASRGKVMYLPDVMSVYRVHDKSATASLKDVQLDLKKSINWGEKYIHFAYKFNLKTQRKYQKILKKSIAKLYIPLYDQLNLNGLYSKSLSYCLLITFTRPKLITQNPRLFCSVLLKNILGLMKFRISKND
jgi:glycosyltransferase involved in cell wall biosynthesis